MNGAKRLTILQMNDTHAYFEAHQEMFLEGATERYRRAGGYARISTLFGRVRDENPGGVLALDNGDTIHGTYPAVASKGESLPPVVNAIGFDGMTAHWEFGYGPEQLKKVVSMLDYPMLAANCHDEQTHETVFEPYTVVERAGLKVGVIGLAEHIVDKTMPPHFSEGVYFTLGNEELPPLIERLRVQQIFVGEEPLDPARTYHAAFVTVQGVPKKYGANRQNLDLKAIDAMRQYIERRGTVSAELKGTVVAV